MVSKTEKYEVLTVTIAIDPDRRDEVALIRKLRLRAEMLEAELEYRAATGVAPETAESAELSPEAAAVVKAVVAQTLKKRGRKPQKVPAGRTLVALRRVHDLGRIDAGAIAGMLYDDGDTKANRDRVYQRVRHWKAKGWLVEVDDEWLVADYVVKLFK